MKACLLSIALCNTLVLAADDDNLVKNAGFEEVSGTTPKFWKVRQSVDAKPGMQHDTSIKAACVGEAKQNGKLGLRLTNFKKRNKHAKFSTFSLDSSAIDVDPAKTYVLTGKVRPTGVKKADPPILDGRGVFVEIKVCGCDEKGDEICGLGFVPVHDAGDGWLTHEAVILPEMWKGWQQDARKLGKKLSSIKVTVSVVVNEESPGVIDVDDLYFGVKEPLK